MAQHNFRDLQFYNRLEFFGHIKTIQFSFYQCAKFTIFVFVDFLGRDGKPKH